MATALTLALLLPLAGFLILLATSARISRTLAGIVASGAIFLSFCLFVALFFTYNGPAPERVVLYKWISAGTLNIDASLLIDTLSLLMALIITGVGFLIHVYSIGYTDHEEDYARYFACLNLFVFAMLLLVLASNLLLLFVGWEGVGLASYLLIGYYYRRPSAAQAAVKAFVVNRVGDFGFLLGILLTFYLFGTVEFLDIFAKANASIGPALMLLTFLIFWGAVGKSAQLPLYTWLPDAMEGPTPVSALIHAATMVTAGVYVVVRMHPLYLLTPDILHLVGIIGGATALFAALCAIGQTDLKRVLAYSTVSQLGYMFLACGAGAFYAAMFHLTSHAFIKALLFLSAGNVVHMMHGQTEMAPMGGLSKIFTKTHWLFLVGVLALSGLPPFAAFFSKELILEQEHALGFNALYYIGLFTSILTSFYLTRAYCLAFTGNSRASTRELQGVREAPAVMLLPVTVLALLALFGALLGFSLTGAPILESFLEKSDVKLAAPETSLELLTATETWVAIAGVLAGMAAAVLLCRGYLDRLLAPSEFLRSSFYINEIYEALIVKPLRFLSSVIASLLEPRLFTNSVDTAGRAAQRISHRLQLLQSGQIRSYIAWMACGTAFLIVYYLFRGTV